MPKCFLAALTALLWVAMQPSIAAQTPGNQTPSAPPAKDEPSIYDRIWSSFTDIYDDSSNPVVQRVAFTGRFHYDFAIIDADQGDHKESNLRRLRLGPRVTLFQRVLFHAELELNPQERDPFYLRFTDLYLQWTQSNQLVFTVGKQGVPFTQEGATSSRELLTIDRSNLANNIWFPQEYMPGVSVSGRPAPWIYRAGLYSSGARNRELGEFNGGVFTLGVIGYDFAKALDVREALLIGNYLYQQPDPDNSFTRNLEQIVSINARVEEPEWGVRADISAASGYLGQSDLVGVMLMPFVNITDKLQVVVRYTLVDSDDINGVQLATYENQVVSGRGDRYDEGYVGVNYYFYGHRLKVQTGLQYADMDDRANDGGAYSGIGWTTGIRVGW
jgi:phosphate-selective porin OprO and OprP